ncbi:hypothetical protein [Pedobacter sp. PACM 27299]|nr:hypothetical protein [Pedobacter sp. PACM 27299]
MEAVFKADQLRYVIGEDFQPLIDIRNGGSDENYMNVLKRTFSPAGL